MPLPWDAEQRAGSGDGHEATSRGEKCGGAGGTGRLRAVCEGVNTEGAPLANSEFAFAQDVSPFAQNPDVDSSTPGWDALRHGEAVRHTRRNNGTGYTGRRASAGRGPVTIRDVA